MTDIVDEAEAASNRADALEAAGDVEGAIKAMSEAIKLAPKEGVYRALRGRLFALKRKWRAAIRDFSHALALKANSPTWLYGRGRARFMIDDLDDAIADFERCIALQPDAADAWEQIGNIHCYRWEWKQALSAYKHALELDPEGCTELPELVRQVKEQIWLLENGQLEQTLSQTRTPSAARFFDQTGALELTDELYEILTRRRQNTVVPYQRKQTKPEEAE